MFAPFFFVCANAQAGVFDLFSGTEGSWLLKQSKVSYTVTHVMHDASGESTKSIGRVNCDKEKICKIHLEILVASFQTAEEKRYAHMQETLREKEFSNITINGVTTHWSDTDVEARLHIQFVGVTNQETVKTSFQRENGKMILSGELPILLSKYKITPPRLIGIAIKDEVIVKFNFVFERE